MAPKYETFGKYLLLEKLATGGMAEVYLALSKGAIGITKFVAIKRILPQYNDSPDFIEMFKDEAKIAINLSHSNIVSIHEFGVEKGQFYLAMDYVEGRNLRQILNKMKKANAHLSVDQIVYICKEAAAGLDHAHRCLDGATGRPLNITHRDMSPQNMMVSFEGEIKIVDFGIAKAESQIETTKTGTLKGKFGYMSPEQADGLAVDLRTDIFSLGIVLWELLAGERLFIANSEINTLRKIRECNIPSLRKINPSISPELEKIVVKALAKDRNLRYQTSAAFHKELNRFLNRQYPDFSPQDFSIFCKTLFASEILDTRKRLIEYSKISAAGEGEVDPTQITNTLTDDNVPMAVEGPTRKENATFSEPANKDDEVNFESGINIRQSTDIVDIDSIKVDNAEILRRYKERQESRLHSEQTGSLNRALKARLQRSRSSSSRDKKKARSNKENNVIGFWLSSGVAALAASFVAYFLWQNFYTFFPGLRALKVSTPPLSQLITQSSQLPVANTQAPSAPQAPAPTPTPSPAPVPSVANPAPATGIANLPAASQSAAQPGPSAPAGHAASSGGEEKMRQAGQPSMTTVLVTSSPAAAEISVNGLSTGTLTPGTIQVETGSQFQLTLRADGYLNYKQTLLADSRLMRVQATLQKARLGYLSINVMPAGATVFINGQALSERPPIDRYAVQAGTLIVVRAENPLTGAADETKISVEQDKVKKVNLFPKTRSKKR